MIRVTEQVKRTTGELTNQGQLQKSMKPTNIIYLYPNEGKVTVSELNRISIEDNTNNKEQETIPDEIVKRLYELGKIIVEDVRTFAGFLADIGRKIGVDVDEDVFFRGFRVCLKSDKLYCAVFQVDDNGELNLVGDIENKCEGEGCIVNFTTVKDIAGSSIELSVANKIFSRLSIRINYYFFNDGYILRTATILSLFIRERYRRKGIGSMLFDYLKRVCGIVSVDTPVLKATDFYAKQGIRFITNSVTPEIYSYIKDKLSFVLTPLIDECRDIILLNDELNIVYGITQDTMLLEPNQENVKGYYIDRIVNGIDIFIGDGIWYNSDVIKEVMKKIENGNETDKAKLKPKLKKEDSNGEQRTTLQ